MIPFRSVARDISYAASVHSRTGRTLIRSVETLTGRRALIRMAQGYDREIADGRDFWEVMVERYRLTLEIARGALANLPTTGPLVVVANHPYGILDGLMLGYILSQRRSDFRILANSVFRRAPDLERVILPIDFETTPAATAVNIATRRLALEHLRNGGCIGIFPGGTVSTSVRPFGRPMDPGWRRFSARLIAKSGAAVVPVYFDGHNSRVFQVASHLHYTLRMALMLNEFRTRIGRPVHVAVGNPLAPAMLASLAHDAEATMEVLRAETYRLAQPHCADLSYGFEFGAAH